MGIHLAVCRKVLLCKVWCGKVYLARCSDAQLGKDRSGTVANILCGRVRFC